MIEETGIPLWLIFGMWRYFGPGSEKFVSCKKFQTFDGVNCHNFESVKNQIKAYISHPMRDRNVKTEYVIYLYNRNRLATPNLKYINSSLNYTSS